MGRALAEEFACWGATSSSLRNAMQVWLHTLLWSPMYSLAGAARNEKWRPGIEISFARQSGAGLRDV